MHSWREGNRRDGDVAFVCDGCGGFWKGEFVENGSVFGLTQSLGRQEIEQLRDVSHRDR